MFPQIPGYTIVKELGRGALGTVYKATDNKDGKVVAVKFLIDAMQGNSDAVKRFKREIRACLQLDHPNLIGAYTAGEIDGKWYYVMEYIEGESAREHLNKHGAMTEEGALKVAKCVAEALRHAASHNLVHRDIKPENIMITNAGVTKLCDMGLAKSVDSEYQVTLQGTVLGTPHYMSPEQAQGEELDFRSDMYSLGATLYHLATGHPPFEGKNPLQVIRQVLRQDPVPPREHNPRITDETTAIIAKMMAKKPDDRYKDLDTLIADLGKAMRQEQTQASGTVGRFASSTPARDLRYDFACVPSDEDMLFGRIALKNGLIKPPDLIPFLDKQEQAARIGAAVRLADVMVVGGTLNPVQKVAIDKARFKFEMDRANELFVKIALDNRYIQPNQGTELRKLVEMTGKDIATLMLEQSLIDDAKHLMILAHQVKLVYWEEERAFVKAAIDGQFITDKQAQKCRVIQSNRLVVGIYQMLGDVLVDKEFLVMRHRDVILRAVRRNGLTGEPLEGLITAKSL